MHPEPPVGSLSPLEGRYRLQSERLRACLPEGALIRCRVEIEVEWLLMTAERPELACVRAITDQEQKFLRLLASGIYECEAERVREIGATTRQHGEAVEYYLRERLEASSLADLRPFVHFCCSSENMSNGPAA